MKRPLLLMITAICLVMASCCDRKPVELKVASYNIRFPAQSDSMRGDGWQRRCPAVASLVEFHDFDLWGSQEVTHRQLTDLLAQLPAYGYIGVGRTDGMTKGEYSPVFYKKEKFEILASGTFWLAEDASKPGKGWDAAYERICTWGKFKDRVSGKRFMVFNLHMDHRGVVARRESAKLVLDTIKSMREGLPVILMGDFNVDQHNESYELIASSGILADSREQAGVVYALNGTFNNFNPASYTTSRIDHIFVSSEFEVVRYGVLTDSYRTMPAEGNEDGSSDFPEEVKRMTAQARMPTDHFPITVTLRYGR